ncbi:phage tail protein [Vibrio sp. S4M6]|uniref:phage tail protein n=1 Tax=Vibrio sinus TaxID=2946865 RepID=UPI00202AB88E|nr:phage tail protein [Vibrio sinus]MCL9783667.1 phage tail protein [Vibrio sinus]
MTTDRYRTYVTQTGFGLESLAKQQGTEVDFAVLVIGDGTLADEHNPASQTDLVNQIRSYPVTIEKDENDASVWIARAEIPADHGGFTINEAGVKVVDENGSLYCYARQPGDYKPNLAEGSSKSYTIRLKFIPGNASTIEAKIDPSVQFTTPTDLENALSAHKAESDPHSQYAKDTDLALQKTNILADFVGLIGEFHTDGAKAGWLDLQGGEFSRTTDLLLWSYAQSTGLVVTQATKDSDPMAYAMYFGDGDGSSTFTLPNHHLGHFVRGTPSYANHGETQGDAIRDIDGTVINLTYNNSNGVDGMLPQGAFSAIDGGGAVLWTTSSSNIESNRDCLQFKASNVVPTADENRPYTANLSIKIHRGWV